MSTEAPLVSVVVTGYERADHLRRTLESLLSTLTYQPLELVLADDGSSDEQQRQMRELPFDRFVFAERNRGLGANTNAGLAAARGEYILQLQDDWECIGPGDFLARGVRLLQTWPSIGLVRYTRVFAPEPILPPHERLDSDSDVLVMHPEPGSPFFLYSDHPHLKSRAFVDAIGPYKESRYMQKTEHDMRDRFNNQDRFDAAFIEGYECFRHIGDDASHRTRLPLARLGGFMDRLPVLRPLARMLRTVKHAIRSE